MCAWELSVYEVPTSLKGTGVIGILEASKIDGWFGTGQDAWSDADASNAQLGSRQDDWNFCVVESIMQECSFWP